MTRGQPGTGAIDQLKSGRWRARVSLDDGTRPSLGTFATEEEARTVLNAALRKIADKQIAPVGGMTLRAWGERWLDGRDRVIADPGTDRNYWKNHIANAPFIGFDDGFRPGADTCVHRP